MYLQVAVDQGIKKVCPIHGVSFGKLDDKSTWIIHFCDEANPEQKAAALNFINNFEWSEVQEEAAKRQADIDAKRNDPIFKLGYQSYRLQNPDATFEQFVDYLNAMQV